MVKFFDFFVFLCQNCIICKYCKYILLESISRGSSRRILTSLLVPRILKYSRSYVKHSRLVSTSSLSLLTNHQPLVFHELTNLTAYKNLKMHTPREKGLSLFAHIFKRIPRIYINKCKSWIMENFPYQITPVIRTRFSYLYRPHVCFNLVRHFARSRQRITLCKTS